MKQHIKSMTGNFRYLFHELYLFRKSSILLPFLGCAFGILLSLVTIGMPKILLDLIESKAEADYLLWKVGLGGCAWLLTAAGNALVYNQIDCCSQTFLYTGLKAKWEEKMMDLDYEVFVSPGGKQSMEKARYAVSSPNEGLVLYLRRVTELLESMGELIALSAIICILHPLIVIWLLLLFAAEMWYGGITEQRKHALQEERARADRKLNYLAYQLRGIREGKDIRIYSMQEWLGQTAREAVAGRDWVEERAARQDFRKMIWNGLLLFVRNVLGYAYLIRQYNSGGMTLGDFALSFAAVTGLGNLLGRLVRSCSDFARADYYAADFRQFMELGGEKESVKGSTHRITESFSVEFEKVSFSYGENPVLKEISFTVKAGEKLAVVGINGAGKTTLVKLLCGLLRPGEGRILINGKDTAGFEGEEYRKLFSAVFQKSGVLPVSIRDNIVLDQPLREEKLWKCLRMANLEEKVRSLPEGPDTPLVRPVAEHGTELSGGEQQRLLLARALYKDAPFLILDEPTAALDPVAESKIYQAYNSLTEGKTSVFVSHRLASTRFCDRILVLENGKIAETGSHEELMKKEGRYAEMFRIQSRYYREDDI